MNGNAGRNNNANRVAGNNNTGIRRVGKLPGFEKIYDDDDFLPEMSYKGCLTIGSFKSSVESFVADISRGLGGKAVGLVAPGGGFKRNACGLYFGVLDIDGVKHDARIARLPVQEGSIEGGKERPYPFKETHDTDEGEGTALYSLIATPLAASMEDVEVRVGVELETCIQLNDDDCGVRAPDNAIREAFYRRSWLWYMKVYANYILKPRLADLQNIRFQTSRLLNRPANMPEYTSMLEEFLRVHPKIGIKESPKSSIITYLIDVARLLDSEEGAYEIEEIEAGEFLEDDYTMPVFTRDSSVMCSDTKDDHFSGKESFSVHCEIVTPITRLDSDNILAMDILFAGLGMDCFAPNSSTGFHVNISLWSKSRRSQIPLSDQMLMTSFLDTYLPYEEEAYFSHRTETSRYKNSKGREGSNPAEYARPLSIEARKRFYNTYYNQILYKSDGSALVSEDEYVSGGLYKVFGNLRRRRAGRSDKYLAVLDKGGGLLEWRLFASSNIKEKLYQHILIVKDLLLEAYEDYLGRCESVAIELNRLVEGVMVHYGSMRRRLEINMPITNSSLNKLNFWSPNTKTPYSYSNTNSNPWYYNKENIDDYAGFLTEHFVIRVYLYQMVSHCLRIMDPLLTQEIYMPQFGHFPFSRGGFKHIFLSAPEGWPTETRRLVVSYRKIKDSDHTVAFAELKKELVPVVKNNNPYESYYGGRRQQRPRSTRRGRLSKLARVKKLKTRRRHKGKCA